jgi:hypothetical protein
MNKKTINKLLFKYRKNTHQENKRRRKKKRIEVCPNKRQHPKAQNAQWG